MSGQATITVSSGTYVDK